MEKVDGERIAKLLLSGATMTDAHCEHCLYPLFEKDGTIFCVNCGTEKKGSVTDGSIIDEKIAFLHEKLRTAETTEEIEKIGKALLVLEKLRLR